MNQDNSVVSFKSVNDTISKLVKTLNPQVTSSLLSNLNKFRSVDLTKQTVEFYISAFNEIVDTLKTLKISKNSKEEVIKCMSVIVNLLGQTECLSIIVNATNEEKEKYKVLANNFYEQLSNLTAKYNKLASDHNAQKTEITIPNINLSITRKDKRKPIDIDTILEITKNLGNTDLEDKFKRYSKKEVLNKEEPNISHIYAKQDVINQVIQK